MKIYESKYVEQLFDNSCQMITSTWLLTTEDMTTEEFKEEMQNLAKLVIKYKAKYLLTITKDLRFAIVPDLQSWIVKTIVPQFIEAKLQKQAIIIPEEIISQLSMEQTIDDVEETKHEHRSKFFSNIENAKAWFSEI